MSLKDYCDDDDIYNMIAPYNKSLPVTVTRAGNQSIASYLIYEFIHNDNAKQMQKIQNRNIDNNQLESIKFEIMDN